LNKAEIKQIILEEIKAAISEQTEDERIAQAMETGDEEELENLAAGALDRAEQEVVDTLTKDYEGDIDDEDIAALQKDFRDESDDMFGKPSFVEEEGLEENDTTDIENAIKRGKIDPEKVKAAAEKAQKGDSKDLALLMALPPLEEMARTSNVFKLKDNHTYDEVLRFMERVNNILKTYKTPGQKRPKKRFSAEDMKKVATALTSSSGFTSKDIRLAVDAYNSPPQANKFIKALEMKGYIELTSQLKKAMKPERDPNAPETRGRKRRDAEFDMSDDPMADLDALGLGGDIDLSDPLAEEKAKGFIFWFRKGGEEQLKKAKAILKSKKISFTSSGEMKLKFLAPADEEKIKKILQDNGVTRYVIGNIMEESKENNNTMSELEKYIKQVIKEAKNPLAKKMKEIENQGRVAALETKLAAIAEMIEETEGRLTRIDEDNEFRDMMDNNAVKEVRKQLKELQKAEAKLQKEYGKAKGKGMKSYKAKEVMDEDLPVAEDAVDVAVDEVELEEDNFKLNESVKRMQKLANLKG
jgi:DNA-binding transcriptional MerR regulator